MPLRIWRQMRLALLLDGGALLDLELAGTMVAFGCWMIHSSWFLLRYPHLHQDLVIVAPTWAWGLWFVAIGSGLGLASVFDKPRILGGFYLLNVSGWALIAWLFCFGAHPPALEGIVAPIHAIIALFRALQIDSPGANSGRATS